MIPLTLRGTAPDTRFRTARPLTHLVLAGIRLRSVEGQELPALEEWEFRVEADGNLNWTVRRRWESDFQAKFVGEPALFFNTRPNAAPTASGQQRLNPAGNGVVPQWWVPTEALLPVARPEYKGLAWPTFFPSHREAVMRAADGWAVFSLYTSFPNLADLRAEAAGGHLYRRGSYNAFTEIGVTSRTGESLRFGKGDQVTSTLRLRGVPASEHGQRLVVEAPDRDLLLGLQPFFGGLANAGALADNVNHYFGNQGDGFLYAGNLWMHGYAMLASVSMPAGFFIRRNRGLCRCVPQAARGRTAERR